MDLGGEALHATPPYFRPDSGRSFFVLRDNGTGFRRVIKKQLLTKADL